ncbi:MAG: hypothetical protein JWO53_516 [Chlamydiia bacterium]|nr:hypothetical protein [Chlamydiia bacterium]
MKFLDTTTWVLLVIAGVNLGLVKIADTDLLQLAFGAGTMLTKIIYSLAGISGVYKVFSWCICKSCKR